jgi:hypothetical protein
MNLLLAAFGIIAALIASMVGRVKAHRDESDMLWNAADGVVGSGKKRVRQPLLMLVTFPAVIATLIFSMTQNTHLPMVLTDWWTPVDLVLLVAEAVLIRCAFPHWGKDDRRIPAPPVIMSVED